MIMNIESYLSSLTTEPTELSPLPELKEIDGVASNHLIQLGKHGATLTTPDLNFFLAYQNPETPFFFLFLSHQNNPSNKP